MSGLTADGLVVETVEEIRDSIAADMKTAFGPQINTSSGAVIGQVSGIMAERYGTLWEAVQAVAGSMDPDQATGAALVGICAITGTKPLDPTESTVTLTLLGDAATVVDEGSLASVTGTEEPFETLADATLVALDAWTISTAYVVGDRVTNGGNGYVATGAGTSAGSGGPTTEDDAITDGTVIWRFMGEGEAAVDVAAQASETGPIVATSGAITTIETPVSGWTSVINLLDATPGRAIEPDATLRIRREVELATAGTSPRDAIRADILAVSGVTACRVFSNVTDTTDGDGVPPHSVEVLVQGGADQDIWDQLLQSVAGGIRTHGTEVGTAVDSEGNDQTVKFSRPEEIEIYVAYTLVVDADEYPDDGDDQVIEACVDDGDAQTTGKNAVSTRCAAQAFDIAGVLEVTSCFIGTAPSPASSATIAISTRQLAVFDTSRVTVVTSNGTP